MKIEDFKAFIAFCAAKLDKTSFTVTEVLDCLEEYNNTVEEDAMLIPEKVFIAFLSIE